MHKKKPINVGRKPTLTRAPSRKPLGGIRKKTVTRHPAIKDPSEAKTKGTKLLQSRVKAQYADAIEKKSEDEGISTAAYLRRLIQHHVQSGLPQVWGGPSPSNEGSKEAATSLPIETRSEDVSDDESDDSSDDDDDDENDSEEDDEADDVAAAG